MTHSAAVVTAVLMLASVAASEPQASQRGTTRESSQSRPPGWSDTLAKTLDLTIAGKSREVLTIYEDWVARFPDFADAHLMLGSAFENLGMEALKNRGPDSGLTALKDFETAATHFRRAFDLGGGETPSIPIRALVDIYGPSRLGLPEQQNAVVREALIKYPAEPRAHSEHIKLLMVNGEQPEAIIGALRAARTAIPKAPERRIEFAALLQQIGTEFAGATAAETVVSDAVTLLDEVLKTNPSDRKALEEKARRVLRSAIRLPGNVGARTYRAAEWHFDRSPRSQHGVRQAAP
jgi:hypothetical protein